MGTSWTIAGLLRDLAARGQARAVIASGEEDVVTWDCAGLAARAANVASKLLAQCFGRGVPTALWAPNSPLWIAAALGILAAGGVLVSVDDQANAAEFEAVLRRSKARVLLTTEEHRQSCIEALAQFEIEVWLLEGATADQDMPTSLAAIRQLPLPDPSDPAALLWTSGTTGSPKAFLLTCGNIASNVEALCGLSVVGPEDTALLPLPLHLAYPLVVGVLTTLTCRTVVVLPGAATGPAIMKALTDGQPTVIVGCLASMAR